VNSNAGRGTGCDSEGGALARRGGGLQGAQEAAVQKLEETEPLQPPALATVQEAEEKAHHHGHQHQPPLSIERKDKQNSQNEQEQQGEGQLEGRRKDQREEAPGAGRKSGPSSNTTKDGVSGAAAHVGDEEGAVNRASSREAGRGGVATSTSSSEPGGSGGGRIGSRSKGGSRGGRGMAGRGVGGKKDQGQQTKLLSFFSQPAPVAKNDGKQ
jgi:hypothetical protein